MSEKQTDLIDMGSFSDGITRYSSRPWGTPALLTLLASLCALTGCNAIKNGWLDPTIVGSFEHSSTMEIRTSLTLEDSPPGISNSVYPTPADLIPVADEYPISEGDTLGIEIYELRQRRTPFQAQAVVSSTGNVNLPVLGRIEALGLTVPQFEQSLKDVLVSRDILKSPDVTVNPLFLQNATYSIFGIGVSASNDAPLRAGTFPIRRPDLSILEAINQVGGLNEFVTDIYVFRFDDPPWIRKHRAIPRSETQAPGNIESGEEETPDVTPAPSPEQSDTSGEDGAQAYSSAERDLIDAVLGTGEKGSDSEQPSETGTSPAEVPESLEPEAAQPYLYVNGEFIENPAHRPETIPGRVAQSATPTLDLTAPANNWARLADDSSYRIIRVPASLVRGGDPDMDIVVRAGDVIRIVSGEIGVYYVMGQVQRVGPFGFNTEEITLKAAIAAAGGLSPLAWPDRCTVYRRLGEREQMIQVNLDRIFAGKDADFLIRRGDIINVGTHPFAPFLQRIRAWTLPNPTSNVGYSFAYSRNFADVDSFSARRNPANEPSKFPALFP